MNASFRQIGKAVPPLPALAVGRLLLAIIARAVAKDPGQYYLVNIEGVRERLWQGAFRRQ